MLGVHCSVKGGLINAIGEAEGLKTDTLQLFSSNPRQWKGRVVTVEEGTEFRKKLKSAGIKRSFAHCSYLLNLSSADEKFRDNSILALAEEVQRCETLGLDYCVLHPGQSKVLSEPEIAETIGAGLKLIIEHTPGFKVKILLENTSGQGAVTGWKFEQLRNILDHTGTSRVGVCFDTCHAFAAGYDIRTTAGIEDTLGKFNKIIGLENLLAFHMNDSKGAFASRIDRHEHIGEGKIGLEPFRYIMKNFPGIPKVLETDHEEDKHVQDLKVLRGLLND